MGKLRPSVVRGVLFILASLASLVVLGWLYWNLKTLDKQRSWVDFLVAGIVGAVWNLFLAVIEAAAARESIDAESDKGKRKGTESWRLWVRVAGGIFSIAAALLVLHAALLPQTHRMVAVGSGTVIDTLLEKRDENACNYLALDYIDSGSREAIPLLARRYFARKDKGAFAVMANRYGTTAVPGGDNLASKMLVTEFALGDYGFVPIVHHDNRCVVFERDRLRDLASGAGGKLRTWSDLQSHSGGGAAITPCLPSMNDPKVDLILPSECRARNSRSGTCTQLARWLSLDVLSPGGPGPDTREIGDVVEEVSRRPAAIAFVTDLSLSGSTSRTGVHQATVIVDSGGSAETSKRWGLFAYLPTVEIDGEYELADAKFLKCIGTALPSLSDDTQNTWGAARKDQAEWLKGRRVKEAWSEHYVETKTGGARVLRLQCPQAGHPICDLADFKER
ncbi:MAG TPA: hypothetical protein VIF57_21470 [Polyangia bacterium]|jgi:hypothetical protein